MPGAPSPVRFLPVLGLLLAASTWGIVWYPYRLLEEAGLHGTFSTFLTYSLGFVLILSMAGVGALRLGKNRNLLLLTALSAGWTNLAYVLSVIDGEVMRVLLLFYLAPLWTLLLSRFILGERTNAHGYVVIVLALVGAWLMLYQAGGGIPLPANLAEWLGLSAGFTFALNNVLARRLMHVPEATRTAWSFIGVLFISSIALGVIQIDGPVSGLVANLPDIELSSWLWLIIISTALVLATFAVQYGLAHTAANRAIVILLSELLVAALASWWLANETMTLREWMGGALIIAASLFSGKMENKPDEQA